MRRFLFLTVLTMSTIPARAADLPPEKLKLPDPLVATDGKRVTTVAEWESKRKPELRRLFETHMYGRRPADPKSVTAVELYRNNKFNDNTSLKEIELRFDVNGHTNPTPIRLLLATPEGPGPFPCFVGISFAGNHSLAPDEGIRIPDNWQYDKQPGVVKNKASAEGRGKSTDVWPLATIVSRGFAVAVFYAGDIQPDRPNVDEGLRKVLPKLNDGADTATVMSWAWGASRVVDYLTTVKSIDSKRLAVVGHSRLGKAALVAGAFDERFAVVIPHQAGCGGSGPSRHDDPKAEAVKRINTSFPHWFCDKFKTYNDDPSMLPFDQNGLVALCAPRPVLFTNAAEDLWANPSGQFAVLKAAEPVYNLYGAKDIQLTDMPAINTLKTSRLGYFVRPGKHSMTSGDWFIFCGYSYERFRPEKVKGK